MKIEEVPKETVDAIREQYGPRTKAALCREFGLSQYMFETIIRKHGILWQDPRKAKVKVREVDYSTMQAVPVPGLPGNAMVYPKKNTDPEAIRQRYSRYGKGKV